MTFDEKIKLINEQLDEKFGSSLIEDENREIARCFIKILDEFARSDNLEEDHRHCGGFDQIWNLCKNSCGNEVDYHFSGENIENLYSEFQEEFTTLYNFFNDFGELETPVKCCIEDSGFDLDEAKKRIVDDGLSQIYNYDLLDVYMKDKTDIVKKFADMKGFSYEAILSELHIDEQENTQRVKRRR
nr:hypothetical protein [Campylobacter sp.]